MNEHNKSKNGASSSGPPGWMMAAQWGSTLVVSTCAFAAIGYFAGKQSGSDFLSICLMLGGLILGFSAALYKIYRDSQKMFSQPEVRSPKSGAPSLERTTPDKPPGDEIGG